MPSASISAADGPACEDDLVKVKVLEVDKQGRIRLSIKAAEEGAGVTAE